MFRKAYVMIWEVMGCLLILSISKVWGAPPVTHELFRITPKVIKQDSGANTTGAIDEANNTVLIVYGNQNPAGGISDIFVQKFMRDEKGRLKPAKEEISTGWFSSKEEPIIYKPEVVTEPGTGRKYNLLKLYKEKKPALRIDIEYKLGSFKDNMQPFDITIKSFPFIVAGTETEATHDIQLQWEVRKEGKQYSIRGPLRPGKKSCCSPSTHTDCVKCTELEAVDTKINAIVPQLYGKVESYMPPSGKAIGEGFIITGEGQNENGRAVPIQEESTAYGAAEVEGACFAGALTDEYPVVNQSFPNMTEFITHTFEVVDNLI